MFTSIFMNKINCTITFTVLFSSFHSVLYTHIGVCSRDVLQQMQNRLRNRMRKKGGGERGRGEGEGSNEGTSEEVKTKNSKEINLRVSLNVCTYVHVNGRNIV